MIFSFVIPMGRPATISLKEWGNKAISFRFIFGTRSCVYFGIVSIKQISVDCKTFSDILLLYESFNNTLDNMELKCVVLYIYATALPRS